MIRKICTGLAIVFSTLASAQPVHLNGPWRPIDELPITAQAAARSQAFLYRPFELDTAALRGNLAAAPAEPTRGFHAFAVGQAHAVVAIPMPDGSTQQFAVVETPCMEPELAARFPLIRAYVGESLELPGTILRCTLTHRGFHALVLSPQGTVVVNPAATLPTDRTEQYIAFRLEDMADSGSTFECTVLGEDPPQAEGRAALASTPLRGTSRNDMTLAYLPTAEWTFLHGNSIESALSAMVELTTRINAIYEKEICVRFILTSEQDKLIQFDAATDGLTNDDSSIMLSEAAVVYDRLTPSLVCQLRHVLGTVGGGIAMLGSVCSTQAGVSSCGLPVESILTVQVAAHEMGHQFSSHHTFGGRGESCASGAGARVEPGSGSTIMGYSPYCYPDNISFVPEFQFHSFYLPEMATRAACGGVVVPLDNNSPTITFPQNLLLRAPLKTPLLLPCSITDAEGDSVAVSWDQIDAGPPASLAQGDLGNNAIIRTFLPSPEGNRVVPRWETLLNAAPSPGELLPTRSRLLKFRAFARDNRAGGAGTALQDLMIAISNSPPFALLTPQDGLVRSSGPLQVTWAVAGTNTGIFNLPEVEISLMRSDDDRSPLILAASTPNDGSEVVTLPDIAIDRARIIVHPINAAFFDVSRKPFEIIPRTSGPDLRLAGPARISDNFANGNSNGRIDSGESRIRVFFPAVNVGSDAAVGALGQLVSLTPTVHAIVSFAHWPTIAQGTSAENATPFVLEVSPDHPCGTPIDLEFTLLPGSSGESRMSFELPVGDSTLKATSTFDYIGSPVLIPDGNPSGVSIPLTVSSLPGPITDVRLHFPGQVTTDPNRPDTGINHPYVGDLVIQLANPQGDSITIADRAGGVGNYGKNFCATVFDSKQIVRNIQTISPGRAPYDGIFAPKEDLNLLAGGSGVGEWTLRIADMRAGQWPTPAPQLPPAVRQFRLELTCQLPAACAAPKQYCEGDLNLDGFVNDDDFVVFVAAHDAFVSSGGDLDGDTLTDDADFVLFVRGYDQLLCP